MKKLSFIVLLTVLCTGVFAQYKKANFFEKTGRTYGLGASLKAIGDGKGSPIGYYVSFGSDKDGKNLFSWAEFQMVPSYSFTKEVTDLSSGNKVMLTVKSRTMFTYAMNWGWHFIKSEEELPPLQPFLTAGFSLTLGNSVKTINEDYYGNTDPYLSSEDAITVGLGGGAGLIYNINSWFGLQAVAGYTLPLRFGGSGSSEPENYIMYTKHPYVSVGVRFRIREE